MDSIVNWLVQGCVVAVTTAGILRALQSARASARYLVCWAGLSAVLVLPLIPAISPAVIPAPVASLAAPASPPLVSVPHAPIFSTIASWPRG